MNNHIWVDGELPYTRKYKPNGSFDVKVCVKCYTTDFTPLSDEVFYGPCKVEHVEV